MGSDKAQENASRPRGDTERRGHSGEGSDSVLRLIRSHRLAQFRETAAEPEEARVSEGDEDERS